MLRLVVFVCVVVGGSNGIKFSDCGSVGGKINSIEFSQCDKEPCQLHHGTTYTANVNFTSKMPFVDENPFKCRLSKSDSHHVSIHEEVTTAKTVIHGIIAGVPLPFPVPDDNACHVMKCPIAAGTTEIYSPSLTCEPSYPKVKLIAKFEVQDQNKKDVMCFMIPVEIVD